jgi:hypothetical protein
VPVVDVAIGRFVIPLHDLNPILLAEDDDWLPLGTPVLPHDPVHAFTRWAERGPVDVSDGRHRILRALWRGQDTVPTRLLVIP